MNHYMIASIRTLILILTLCIGGLTQDLPMEVPREPALAFEAKPTKAAYAKGERVEFDFVLRNISRGKIIAPRSLRLTLNVSLDISDSQGKPAEWCGRIADQFVWLKSQYVTLAPGESVRARLAVSCVGKDDPRRAWGYGMTAPGKYVIKGTYRLPQPKEYFEHLFPSAYVARGPVLARPVVVELQ